MAEVNNDKYKAYGGVKPLMSLMMEVDEKIGLFYYSFSLKEIHQVRGISDVLPEDKREKCAFEQRVNYLFWTFNRR